MKEKLYQLTNPQKSIWLTEQYYQNIAINTICGYVFFKDVVDLEVLKNAINELVKSNDGMRLKLKEENQFCVQYVDDYQYFDIDVIDLTSEKDVKNTAIQMANTPLMSSSDFLFHFLLFKLPNGLGGFIVNVHHIIGDSWSLGLIAKEVTRIYSELLKGTYESQNLPSYLDYIKSENEYKTSDKYLKDKAYWEDVFQTVPEIASLSSAKNDLASYAGKREKFTLSKNDLVNIKCFCDKYKISIYNFFMSVYSLYISKVTNINDFVIGTPILNRTNYNQKHTMGMFVSVAPLRINVIDNSNFIDFAKKIATDTMSVFRHQKYSYQSILENLRKRNPSIPNLYNIILSYQITKTVEENSNVNYSTDWVFNGNCADELQIHLFDINDESSMTVAYDYKLNLFSNQEIINLHNRIVSIIYQIIENNDILLKDISIITDEEKNKILNEFNNTYIDYRTNKTIVDLFEDQVKKTPNNIALIFENQRLTFKELNNRANKLARYLINNERYY